MVSLSNHYLRSFDRLRMTGGDYPLMVSLSNHPFRASLRPAYLKSPYRHRLPGVESGPVQGDFYQAVGPDEGENQVGLAENRLGHQFAVFPSLMQ